MKETFFWDFSSDAISTLSDLTSEGFEVDWTVRSSSKAITSGFVMQGEVLGMIEFTPEPSDAYTFVHKLEVRMDKKNQGIAGLLLAHVAQDAFNRGFDVSFKDCSFRLLRASLWLQSYCKYQPCNVSYGSMSVAH